MRGFAGQRFVVGAHKLTVTAQAIQQMIELPVGPQVQRLARQDGPVRIDGVFEPTASVELMGMQQRPDWVRLAARMQRRPLLAALCL